jgi:hypothetical protein
MEPAGDEPGTGIGVRQHEGVGHAAVEHDRVHSPEIGVQVVDSRRIRDHRSGKELLDVVARLVDRRESVGGRVRGSLDEVERLADDLKGFETSDV